MRFALSRRPGRAIQLYIALHSAIQYTAIQRYTVYMLYIIPLGIEAVLESRVEHVFGMSATSPSTRRGYYKVSSYGFLFIREHFTIKAVPQGGRRA